MTYRLKVFSLLIALVVISSAILALVNYRECNSMLKVEIHRKARSIAATAAALLDPGLVGAIRQRGDESRPEYAQLLAKLRKIRDYNRRRDVWTQQIFTLVPALQNPQVVEYGADAEERFEYAHHPGDIYTLDGKPVTIGLDGINKLAENLGSFQAGYGSSFSPIKDTSGKLIAVVGVTLVPGCA